MEFNVVSKLRNEEELGVFAESLKVTKNLLQKQKLVEDVAELEGKRSRLMSEVEELRAERSRLNKTVKRLENQISNLRVKASQG